MRSHTWAGALRRDWSRTARNFLSTGDTVKSISASWSSHQCIVSQNSSFFSLYTSNGPVLLWAFFMGARIVLYVVVALLIGSSVVLAVHSLRDH